MNSLQSTVTSPMILQAAHTAEAAPADSLTQQGFPFLKLPPELKQMIYDLVFISPANIGTCGTLTKISGRMLEPDAIYPSRAHAARSGRRLRTIFSLAMDSSFIILDPFLNLSRP